MVCGEFDNNGLSSGITPFKGTTVVAVRRNGSTAMAADGQVTLGNMIIKDSAVKLRSMDNARVLAGFAGSTADALTLSEKFETFLSGHKGNIRRAAVELAKIWRTEKALRHLSAVLLVADADSILIVSGTGDVLEPEDGVAAIGSGASSALAAARVLIRHTDMNAECIARESLSEAARICIYTNSNISVEVL